MERKMWKGNEKQKERNMMNSWQNVKTKLRLENIEISSGDQMQRISSTFSVATVFCTGNDLNGDSEEQQ